MFQPVALSKENRKGGDHFSRVLVLALHHFEDPRHRFLLGKGEGYMIPFGVGRFVPTVHHRVIGCVLVAVDHLNMLVEHFLELF